MASLFDTPVLGGLFDVEPGAQRQALNMGLLGLGLGMLESGRFGPGLRNFQSLYQSGLQSGQAAEEKERKEQLDELYKGLFDNTGTQVADASGTSPGGLFGNLSPEQRAVLSTLPAEQGLPILLEQSFRTPEAPTTRTVRIGNEQVTQQFNPSTNQWEEVGRGLAFKTTPDTVVKLPTQENAEAKAFGEDLVAQYTTIRENAANAGNVLTQLEIARGIPVQTGALEPFKAKVSALAQSVGVDPTTLGLQGATNPQAVIGIMQNLVLAKMQAQKGPQTQQDAERIEKTVASLGNTPQAADFLIKAAIATERRKVQQANFYDQWRADKGTFEGARAAWEQYKRETPLMGTNPNSGLPVFFDEFQTLMRQANPTATDEQILALWRQKYGRTR